MMNSFYRLVAAGSAREQPSGNAALTNPQTHCRSTASSPLIGC
jgi:hypothetical protein